MTREELMAEKQQRINAIVAEQVQVITSTAEAIVRHHRKPFIARCDRRPKKKSRLLQNMFFSMMKVQLLDANKFAVMSQPIPKFPKGAAAEYQGPAFVGDFGKEEIIINPKK